MTSVSYSNTIRDTSMKNQEESPLLFSRPHTTITWKNLSYAIPGRVIIDRISGITRAGQLLGIIGSTGSGKSTLLDILAGRDKVGKISGEILINGEPVKKAFKEVGAYVSQDEYFMGNLTVEETLRFYARLKLSTSHEEQDAKIEDVINKFGLSNVATSRVGTQFKRGLSGGEKKRLAIACEFITNPSLILLDEPTSGLDSVNAFNIMEELQNLAHNEGCTVIATVHQPSGKIFKLLDQLLIMGNGQMMYFGNAMDTLAYFREQLGKNCGQFENPADFFLESVDELNKSGQPIPKLPDITSNLDLQDVDEDYDESSVRRSRFLPKYAGLFSQFLYLVWRNFLNFTRDPRTSYAQLGQTIFLSLLVGSIYFGLKDDQKSIQNRMGAIFFIVTNQAFGGFPVLSLFMEERDLFKRERASSLYGVFPYYIARFVTELPNLVVLPLIFSSISYWMIGFRPDATRFAIFYLTIVIETFTTSSLFVMVGSIAPNMSIAQILAPISLVLFMLFGGFLVNSDSIPIYYIWLKYISFFKYVYEILMVNEFKGLTFICDVNCIPTGDIQLAVMGMKDVDIWMNMAILVAMSCFYRLIGFLVILFFRKEIK